jgi:hypothetical protein
VQATTGSCGPPWPARSCGWTRGRCGRAATSATPASRSGTPRGSCCARASRPTRSWARRPGPPRAGRPGRPPSAPRPPPRGRQA